MKRLLTLATLLVAAACVQYSATLTAAGRWARHASDVTIVRDDWGIAHVFGKTDADAVCPAPSTRRPGDFNRVETNFINAMGRLAETEGEARIWQTCG
ncbi:MAG: penicillin acylase family protein [Vicinamibacterales bacterium]